MATMIERVARAIDPNGWSTFEAYCAVKEYDAEEIAAERARSGRVQISLAQAHAAVKAMRIPSDAMVEAAEDVVQDIGYCARTGDGDCPDQADVFVTMIDAALAEPQS